MPAFEYSIFFVMFTIVPIFIFIGVAIVFTMVFSRIANKAGEDIANSKAQVQSVDAVVIAKRQETNHINEHYTETRYFVTFQADDGRRAELEMKGEQYGLLIEGDYGKLTYQGNRYIGFTRT